MGVGCIYIVAGQTKENTELVYEKKEDSCCTPSNLQLKFTNRDGDLHYAFLVCKVCGRRHVKFSGE